MSRVYATEPTSSGRVIFETTHGPLDISLWCRECPSTTKLFMQLCLDGYYDNMLFHRIVPSLLIQTGAIRTTVNPESSQTGLTQAYRTAVQADEALERRQYELNARLRFNHRGQVAMALGISDEDKEMHPQFFITTADAPYLDGKHVLFGTLGSGSPTIFNAIRINGTAVDEGTNQPVELEQAPRILSVKIVENEIHTDLVPQESIPWRVVGSAKPAKKKKKRKGKLDVNVLSFGDEMGTVEEITVKNRPSKKLNDQPVAETKFDNEHETGKLETTRKQEESQPICSETASKEVHLPSESQPKQRDEPNSDKSNALPSNPQTKDPLDEGAKKSLVELRRLKYTKKKKSKQEREDQTIAKLSEFQQKLGGQAATGASATSQQVDTSLAARMARREEEKQRERDRERIDNAVSYHGQVLDSDSDGEHHDDWMETRFKCRRHIDHSAGADGRDANEYEVIDEKKRSRNEDKSRKSKKHKKRHRDY